MSNRNNTRVEIGNEFNIQIPGKVPLAPPIEDHFQCDCDHCKAYIGTYTYDVESDGIGTPEMVQ